MGHFCYDFLTTDNNLKAHNFLSKPQLNRLFKGLNDLMLTGLAFLRDFVDLGEPC